MPIETPDRWIARDGLALWLLAFVTSAVIGTHGIAYWDAGDYTLLAITGGKSGLLLGRPLFLWISRLVLQLGIDPANAESVLRWFWSAVGATAAPALAILSSRLGLDRRSALMAGAALALSPSFAHTSHQVLTDAPALALSIAALATAASARLWAAWFAGALLAAAIATRETAAVLLVPALLLVGVHRSAFLILSCAATLAAIVAIHRPPGVDQWFDALFRSASVHPWSVSDLFISIAWVLAAGPAPVAAGAWALMRGEGNVRVRKVAIPAAVGTALLLFYPDGSFSPRYVLATVPIAFFIIGAPWLARRTMIAAGVLMLPLVVAVFPAARANAVAAYGATLDDRIRSLPARTVVVPGHFCPQARLAAAIAKREDLGFICPGWAWPADVADELNAALLQDRAVAVDVTDQAWVGRREAGPRDAVRAWLRLKDSTPLAGFRVVRP